MIDSPYPYSPAAAGLLTALGIDPVALSKDCNRASLYRSMGLKHGFFFDKETFGVDQLVTGAPAPWYGQGGSWPDFVAKTPLAEKVRADILRIETGETDYMPGLDSATKKDRLSRMSYRDYLLNVAKVDPRTVLFYQSHTDGEWGVGIDAVSALDCWGFGFPSGGLSLLPAIRN